MGGKKSSVVVLGLTVVIALCSIGMAIAACVITACELWWSIEGYLQTYGYLYPADTYYFDTGVNLCLLSPLESVNMCAYSWAAAAIGILFAIIVAAATFGALGKIGVLAALVNCIWWLGAAITLTIYGKNADSDTLTVNGVTVLEDFAWPEEGYRTSIWAMAWAQFGIYAVQLLLSAMAAKSTPEPGAPPAGGAYKAEQDYYKGEAPPPVAGPPAVV